MLGNTLLSLICLATFLFFFSKDCQEVSNWVGFGEMNCLVWVLISEFEFWFYDEAGPLFLSFCIWIVEHHVFIHCRICLPQWDFTEFIFRHCKHPEFMENGQYRNICGYETSKLINPTQEPCIHKPSAQGVSKLASNMY